MTKSFVQFKLSTLSSNINFWGLMIFFFYSAYLNTTPVFIIIEFKYCIFFFNLHHGSVKALQPFYFFSKL